MAAKRHETHDGTGVSCWDCLTPDEQTASRRAWFAIASEPTLRLFEDPRFVFDFYTAISEVRAGQVLQMKRPDMKGQRILFPYSLFWRVVDVIHEERKQLRE